MKTRFYYHPIFLEHDPGPHPECAARLVAVRARLEERYGADLTLIEPRRADPADAARVHDPAYLAAVEGLCRRGGGYLDGDTPVSERSFEAALHALGACLDGADALMEGTARSAFALVRPPGHHARPAAGMGFCLVNHAAAAAAYLRDRHEIARVLIADFDVHHGNGTQEIFYADPAVFYLSVHRHPFYPGTGTAEETGRGPGAGFTRNLPFPPGTPAETIARAFSGALAEVLDRFRPEAILVSAGFDGFAGDPIGGLGLEAEQFLDFGRTLKEVAEAACEGRILSVLEGGYSLSGLPRCLEAYVDGLE